MRSPSTMLLPCILHPQCCSLAIFKSTHILKDPNLSSPWEEFKVKWRGLPDSESSYVNPWEMIREEDR